MTTTYGESRHQDAIKTSTRHCNGRPYNACRCVFGSRCACCPEQSDTAACCRAGIAIALARKKKPAQAGDPEPGRKRRASFTQDDGVSERTTKRRDIEEVNIFGGCTEAFLLLCCTGQEAAPDTTCFAYCSGSRWASSHQHSLIRARHECKLVCALPSTLRL